MGGQAGIRTLLSNSKDSNSKYFCSELVAAAPKGMGLMHGQRNEKYFWPGEFAKGGALDRSLIEGARYGEETIIDCQMLEIGQARVVNDEN